MVDALVEREKRDALRKAVFPRSRHVNEIRIADASLFIGQERFGELNLVRCNG